MHVDGVLPKSNDLLVGVIGLPWSLSRERSCHSHWGRDRLLLARPFPDFLERVLWPLTVFRNFTDLVFFATTLPSQLCQQPSSHILCLSPVCIIICGSRYFVGSTKIFRRPVLCWSWLCGYRWCSGRDHVARQLLTLELELLTVEHLLLLDACELVGDWLNILVRLFQQGIEEVHLATHCSVCLLLGELYLLDVDVRAGFVVWRTDWSLLLLPDTF